MKKKICVVGAGCVGIIAVKSFKEEGFDVVCYEKESFIGGLWVSKA
jgi:dimethylaniline monooxygenase (N-oxide forming)